MKLILSFSLFIVALLGCSLVQSNHSEIQIVDVKWSGQFYDPDQDISENVETVRRLVFKGNDKLYVVSYPKTYYKLNLNEKGETASQEETKRDTVVVVYATHKGEQSGIAYTFEKSKIRKRGPFNVDSLVKALGYTSQNFKSLGIDWGKPGEVIKEKTLVTEKFLVRKTVPAEPDSIYRYFDSRLKDVDFSFAPDLDRQYQSKLVKFLAVFRVLPKNTLLPDSKIPRRMVMENSMRIVTEKDPRNYAEIFETFKLDRKKTQNK